MHSVVVPQKVQKLPVDLPAPLSLLLLRFPAFSEHRGSEAGKREGEACLRGGGESIPFQRKSPSRLFSISSPSLTHTGFNTHPTHTAEAETPSQCVRAVPKGIKTCPHVNIDVVHMLHWSSPLFMAPSFFWKVKSGFLLLPAPSFSFPFLCLPADCPGLNSYHGQQRDSLQRLSQAALMTAAIMSYLVRGM